MDEIFEQRLIEDIGQTGKRMWERRIYQVCLLLGLILVVCSAVVLVHWPALSVNALSFDDGQYLVENLLVQNPSWASARDTLTYP